MGHHCWNLALSDFSLRVCVIFQFERGFFYSFGHFAYRHFHLFLALWVCLFSLKLIGLMGQCCLNLAHEYLPAFVFRQWDNVLFHFSLFAYVPHIIWLSMQTFQEHLDSSSKKKSLRAKTRVVPQIWQYVLPISVTQHGSPNAKSFFATRWMSIGERVGWMVDTTILSLHAFALIQRDFFFFFSLFARRPFLVVFLP